MIPSFKLFFPLIKCFLLIILLPISGCIGNSDNPTHINISGVYPHLAMYNNEDECGTGAVVPWADKLWVITYGPHLPEGSSDKLYEIDPGLKRVTRPESIGGTPANRMIHHESNQLFIGPYAISSDGAVRTIPYSELTGRHTGNARHFSDPANKIYYATMEEGFYEVDVHTLEVTTLYKDARTFRNEGSNAEAGTLLPGAHGKGLYSGQGVMVYSNNGESGPEALRRFDVESGSLSEWDGTDWKVVRRNQFVEVTGPGGIYGNTDPANDPLWATGWDHKSLLLAVRDQGEWSYFRLPKASHSYDGAHGWNTEWPRIRDVGVEGAPDYLMTMHGMFWKFPGTFAADATAGIRPRSAYLKVIGDFAQWKGKLVMGCDDSARKEFLNKRKVKGEIGGPGQSNSNLWFTDTDMPDKLGPATASGAVWLEEQVKAGAFSEPFLFAGWDYKVVWVANHGKQPLTIGFEVDEVGSGQWADWEKVVLEPGAAEMLLLDVEGEWIRARVEEDATVTVHFSYTDVDERPVEPAVIFNGISRIKPMGAGNGINSESGKLKSTGLLYGLGHNRRALGMSASYEGVDAGYYELDSLMQLVKKEDPEMQQFIDEKFAIPKDVVKVEESSVLVIDDLGRRWRFPLGDDAFDAPTIDGSLRICREVATERDLFNLHGTFYELPAENADGFAKVRPVASHNFRIHDYASYRGLLVMTGVDPAAAAYGSPAAWKGRNDSKVGTDSGGKNDSKEVTGSIEQAGAINKPGKRKQTRPNDHIFVSEDGKAAVWAGVIDDLWKLGKPTGHGGPWKDSEVTAGVPSDPYLIGFYDRKTLALHHVNRSPVTFTIAVEPIGHGPWMEYMEVTVQPGEVFEYEFPEHFQARWIRFTADTDCKATAWLEYKAGYY